MATNVLGSVGTGIIPEPFLRAESVGGKFFLMFFAIAFFAAVFGLVLFLASLFKGRRGEKAQGVDLRGAGRHPARRRPDVPRDPHHHPVPAGTLG